MLTSLVVLSLLAADAPKEFDAWLDSPRSVPLIEHPLLARSHVTAIEPRRGVPSFLWAERGPSLRAQGLNATEAARQHLLRYAPLWRLDGTTVAQLVVSELHDQHHGAVIVGFARTKDGIPFLRDELDLVMTENLELVAITGSLATQRTITTDFRLDAASAMSVAAGVMVDPSTFKPTAIDESGWVHFSTHGRARRVYFDTSAAVLPAWHVEHESRSLIISAVDGAVLSSIDRTSSLAHTYRVWGSTTGPLDNPLGDGTLPFPAGTHALNSIALAPSLVTIDHAGISTGDSWLPAGALKLDGNNVHAYADLTAPDGFNTGDFEVSTSAATTFDFTYDLTQTANASTTQHAASATQAFFTANWMHDTLYDLGFTEQARNGQNDNYGRGGLGGDALKVEVHDFAGRNNASLLTTADGEASRMQLFLFDERRASRLTLSDGGVLPAPPAVTLSRAWNTTGPVHVLTDVDGGHSGCDAWVSPAQHTGAVVVVDVDGCNVADRFAAAKDAGVAALVVTSDDCFPVTEGQLVAVCLSANAGTHMRDDVLAGATPTATLSRPAGDAERDVALDTTVVAHEYTHFLSQRLIGDSEGLFNGPGRAMGEGWSDFVSLWLTLRESDATASGNTDWNGSFAIGGWVLGGPDFIGNPSDSLYSGLRRFPYSSARTVNPLTFKHVGTNVPLPTTVPRDIGGGPDNAEVHNAGEVWASMLWDVQAALLRRPGANFATTRTTMGRYLVASLKATPVLPTFIEARDALLAVIYAESPNADFPIALDAFAQRGLGIFASSSDRRSTTNVPLAEDFTGTGGNLRLVSLAVDDNDDDCDADGQLDADETGTMTVTLMNVGSKALSHSRMSVTTDAVRFTLPTSTLAVPTVQPFGIVQVVVPVSLNGGATGIIAAAVTVQVTDVDLATPQHLFESVTTLRLNTDTVASSIEDFEGGATSWRFDGEGGFPWEDVWWVRARTPVDHFLIGPDMRSAGSSTATTPAVMVGAEPFRLSWMQAYSFENSVTFFDGGRLEISTDGTTFTAVPSSALTPGYPVVLQSGTDNPLAGQAAFGGVNPTRHLVTADFGTQYAGQTVHLRWVIGADASGQAGGWNVDDVTLISGAMVAPFQQLVAHRAMCINHPPMVSNTSSISVDERAEVTLVPGTIVDADQDQLSVFWEQTSGPMVTLVGNVFTAPDVAVNGATLGFKVTVSDGRGGSDADEMTVTLRNVNRPPEVGKVTAPQVVFSGDAVALEVTGEDVDGDAVHFAWTQETGPTSMLGDVSSDHIEFTAPVVKEQTELKFTVTALDASSASETVFVTVIVQPKPGSCGCSSGESIVALLLIAVLRRRRPQFPLPLGRG